MTSHVLRRPANLSQSLAHGAVTRARGEFHGLPPRPRDLSFPKGGTYGGY